MRHLRQSSLVFFRCPTLHETFTFGRMVENICKLASFTMTKLIHDFKRMRPWVVLAASNGAPSDSYDYISWPGSKSRTPCVVLRFLATEGLSVRAYCAYTSKSQASALLKSAIASTLEEEVLPEERSIMKRELLKASNAIILFAWFPYSLKFIVSRYVTNIF